MIPAVTMTRRGFLKRGVFGGAILACGGLGLGLWPTRLDRQPRRKLRVLNERQFAILSAVAARTVQAPGADPIEIASRVDDTLALQAPEVRHDIGQLLLLFDNALAGLFLDARPRPFTRLSPAGQDAVLDAWRRSRLTVRRGGYNVLRKLTQAAHYSSPSTWASVGYPGPPEISQPT